MKRIKYSMLAAILVFSLAAGCPNGSDPFFIAKTTVTGARVAISAAEFAFAKADQLKITKCTEEICIKVDPDKGTKYKECMAKDQTVKVEYQTCYKGMKEAIGIWDKAKKVALATANAAEEAIKLSEKYELAKKSGDPKELEKVCSEVDPQKGADYAKCMKGEKVSLMDWMAIIKSGLCLAAKSLAFMPAKYDSYVKPVIALFESYGCTATSMTKRDAKKLIAMVRRSLGNRS